MLSLLLGLAVTGTYLTCSLIAYLHYPGEFSLLHGNLLGQLGDHRLDPRGSGIYLVGCLLTGTLTVAFFGSLVALRSSGTRARNRLLAAVQILGAVGACGLFMTGIYPEEYHAPHHFWSGLLFASFGVALLLSPAAVWRRHRSDVALIALAGVSCTVDIVSFVRANQAWIEWATVALFMVYTWLLGAKSVQAGVSQAPGVSLAPESPSRRTMMDQ